MKICVALHSCMDLGGIINHTEQLIGGFQELGHEVRLMEFVYADYAHGQGKSGSFERGPSGIPYDQGKGWNFGKRDRVAYKTTAGMNSAKLILNEFDLVIWTVPVPPKNKVHLGNSNWPELYALEPEVKQVAFIHDGNCKQNSPHLYHVLDHLSGIACVHGCALNGADHLPKERALVLNPQFKPVRDVVSWDDKHPGFVNMQTFKAWKHVHELIEAIAYMPAKTPGELREVAGKGIEYQYMTSINKCKPAYFHDPQDLPYEAMSNRIWDVAVENGMVHHDYWPTSEVREWLDMARVLVDPSWSKKYSKIGGHWNRVVVDAMIHGAVPVAQRRGMGDELFQSGVHYVDLNGARDAQDYADIVLSAGQDDFAAAGYRAAALDLLPQFDRKAVAQRVIDLANQELDDTQIGTTDAGIYSKYQDLMFDHYGVLV